MASPIPYTDALADAICDRLVEGESLRKICLSEDMPSASLVCRWLGEQSHFREQYARAREAQADTLADEILDIADDGSNDWMGEDETYNGDAVQRSKLRVDARKWLAAKMQPKKYGDKIDVTTGGEAMKLDEVSAVTRLTAIAASLAQRAGHAADDPE